MGTELAYVVQTPVPTLAQLASTLLPRQPKSIYLCRLYAASRLCLPFIILSPVRFRLTLHYSVFRGLRLTSRTGKRICECAYWILVLPRDLRQLAISRYIAPPTPSGQSGCEPGSRWSNGGFSGIQDMLVAIQSFDTTWS